MDSERRYYVYIMASRSLTLYTGVTANLYRRVMEHKHGELEGFTKRYNINRLVYYETFKYIGNAIAREKQVKAWTRAKRLALIKGLNPTWQDLAEGWGQRIELQIPRFARDDNSNNLRRDRKQGLNPTWQDLAEGWGQRIELQIPRFARDDNPSEGNGNPDFPHKNLDRSKKGLTESIENLTVKD